MKVSIRAKLLTGILGCILLLGSGILIFIHESLSNRLITAYEKRGVSLAKDISDELIPAITSGDRAGARALLLQHKDREENVVYILIVTPQGKIFAHTFPGPIPSNLLESGLLNDTRPYGVKKIPDVKGLILDIACPIQKTRLGVLHLGLLGKPVVEELNYAVRDISIIAAVILILGALLAISLSRLISRPVLDFIKVTRAVSQGDLEQMAVAKTGDELEDLADSLNEMTGQIKAARARLGEARDYVSNIIENMFESLIVVDPEAKIKTINQATLSLLGYRQGELIGHSAGLVIRDGDRIFMDLIHQLIREQGPIQDYDVVYLTRQGESIPVTCSISALWDASGRLAGVICLARDLREIKRLISELSQIYNGAPSPIRVIDTQFRVISQNEAMSRLIGVSSEEAKGRHCYELLRGPNCRTGNCSMRLILKGRKKIDREAERTTPEGDVIPCRLLANPFRNAQGKIVGVIEVFINIAERREFIRRLEAKGRELADALENQQAYADIMTSLSSIIDLRSLLEDVLIKIAGYTNSQLGIIYLFKNSLLVPHAAYSLEMNGIKDFQPGEGIPGECALEKRPIMVSDVPDDYFTIRSGAGETPPRHVACVPIMFKSRLVGVLELASLEGFGKKELDFLNVVADQLGVGIDHALAYRKAGELAAELQEKNELLMSQNEELQSQGEELLALNEELQSQAEELAVQKKALEDKTRQVEEANRLKSEFLSNMSHELRTPLNAILGMTRLLKDEASGITGEQQAGYLEIIERNGQNLLELINDILDISKIEAGKVEIIWSRIDLKAFTQEVLQSVRALADEKELELGAELDPEADFIISDPDKLRQILLNLLSNAIKFTEKGSISVITRCEEENKISLAVRDTGIGISEDELEYIFDAFRQVDSSTTRVYGGTGLGLNIVKKLVDLLGGEIHVESQVGMGSTFTVTLPRQPVTLKEMDENWKEKVRSVLLTGETTSPEGGTGPKARKHILIIDDDPIATRELSVLLKEEDYQLHFAFNGLEGLKHIRNEAPDLVLLDLKMPDMDGFSLIKEMQKDERTRNIPVVVLSAMDLSGEEKGRLAGNVRDVILKGQIDKAAFLDTVGRALYGEKPPERTRAKAQVAEEESRIDVPHGPARILIVEDNKDNLFLLKQAFRHTDYELYTAENGAQALETARKVRPDLILMDMLMPVMDGYEATSKIREIRELAGVPIIALTARAMRGDREKTLAAGCNDYISKPINPAELVERVGDWLRIFKKRG